MNIASLKFPNRDMHMHTCMSLFVWCERKCCLLGVPVFIGTILSALHNRPLFMLTIFCLLSVCYQHCNSSKLTISEYMSIYVYVYAICYIIYTFCIIKHENG